MARIPSVKEDAMMKIARFVLKIIAASLALAAAVCAVIAFWDKILDAATGLKDVLSEKKANCRICRPAEYEDFADLD